MNPYDAEAYAFSCSHEDQPDAFRVAADAFEQVGLLEAAEHRRSWADQIERIEYQLGSIREIEDAKAMFAMSEAVAKYYEGEHTSIAPENANNLLLSHAIQRATTRATVLILAATKTEAAALDRLAQAMCRRPTVFPGQDEPSLAIWRRITIDADESKFGPNPKFNWVYKTYGYCQKHGEYYSRKPIKGTAPEAWPSI